MVTSSINTALFVLAGGIMGLILIGIRNAWDIVTYIAMNQDRLGTAPRDETSAAASPGSSSSRSAVMFGAPILVLGIAGSSVHPRTIANSAQPDSALLVMNAASITQPVRAVLDSFSARTGIAYHQEPGSSLEVARRLTELGRQPDVLLLADPEVYPTLLMPRYVTWYASFGRNRMVLAYTPRSAHAGEITADNWRQIVQRPDVQVGRSDPNTDPSGYRTLFVFQLAERYYHEPGLAARLRAAAPQRNVRPREADQIGLLQAGELDYIWSYQNLADNAKLETVRLRPEIDLGTPADSAIYATASARVVGRRPGDTVVVRGAPILFALSIPNAAPHAAGASRLVAFLLSPAGLRILRSMHFETLDRPLLTGSGAPAALDSLFSAAVTR
jgi:molybdate/tungstate transport system substrate-binding protein